MIILMELCNSYILLAKMVEVSEVRAIENFQIQVNLHSSYFDDTAKY